MSAKTLYLAALNKGNQLQGASLAVTIIILLLLFSESAQNSPHPAKVDLNKKWLPKQKIIHNFSIDAKGSEKQEMKILPCGK